MTKPDAPTLKDSFLAWRKERVTVERVQSHPILDHDVAFTEAFDEWRRLKHLLRPRDELWTFCSPQEEWERFMGWEGILLLRGSEIVEVVVTAQN